MRRLIALALLACPFAGPADGKPAPAAHARPAAPAGAAKDDTPAEPAPTIVAAALVDKVARITVRYDLQVPAAGTESEVVSLAMPPDAAVIHAMVASNGAQHRLALVDATQASADLRAVLDAPVGPHQTSTVLVEGGDGRIEVSITAPRSSRLVLDVELRIPTCFYRDVRYAIVPDSWQPRLPPALRTLAASPTEIAEACSDGGSTDALWVGFATREVAQHPATLDRVGTSAGRLALGTTHLARLELDVAGMLAGVPQDLATAIVIDGSRSVSNDEHAVQRALVASYLRKSPRGRVQVIAYDRHARPLLPAWTVASRAAPKVDGALDRLTPANGSNVEAGLTEAGSWLSQITGTRRIVLVTDERLANALAAIPAARLAKLVPAGTLLHVVALTDTGEAPARDDHAALAPLAAATAGMAIRTGLPDGGLDATLLVRPLTVDHVHLQTPGWKQLAVGFGGCPETLVAGSSCTWWGRGDALAGPLAIEAFVWGERIVRDVHFDPGQASALARELTHRNVLDPTLHEQAEVIARAVNGRWSLFARWGGADGYGAGFGMMGWGCGCGGGSSSSTAIGSSGRLIGSARPRPPFDLHAQLATAVARCAPGSAKIDADVENTLDEIVAVQVVVHGAADPRALHACVEDAIWSVALVVPPQYPHEMTHVTFGK
jgi:hypothetical protein